MNMHITEYTKDRIEDVIHFEIELRAQEPDTYFWDIDEAYKAAVLNSFENKTFADSALSLLAYRGERVVGRIDASLIFNHFDGMIYEAYLNWICVLKSERHNGVAQLLLETLKERLKERGIEQIVCLTAGNEDAVKFYDACKDIKFERGAMIKIK